MPRLGGLVVNGALAALLGFMAPLALADDRADLVAKGERVFQVTAGDIGCQICHGTDATGDVGPDIRGRTLEVVRGALEGVRDMSFLELSEDDIVAVAAYLLSLGPPETPQPAAAGKTQPSITLNELLPLLTRYGVGPNQEEIELTYAPPLLYQVVKEDWPPETEGRPTVIFVLVENIHDGEFLAQLPAVFLRGPGGERIIPYDASIMLAGPHHRRSRLMFETAANAAQPPGGGPAPGEMTLLVPFADGTVDAANTFVWKLPLNIPATTR